ncbi:MAG: hypothetical protein H6Q77_1702 [Gemmatimonadetes bacterium]|nr:hypothetical protein [Gemmatimonadota bacterium]
MSRLTPGVKPSLPAFVVMLGQLVASEPARAQGAESGAAAPESTTVVAGPGYAAGGLHKWLFGKHYRTLWTTPIRVEVLDLGTFAGGLRPIRQGGGLQTQSLRFAGADGRQYAFRSVNKDASKILPPDLRNTLAARVAQDQISAAHPAGAAVAASLARAAGVLHSDPRLVSLPDDPRLGEFRTEFAGVLGFIEERPDENEDPSLAFAGAPEIVSTDELYEIIEKKPGNYVDSEQFLRARLLDVFMGDWDRHRDQWRWARLKDGDRFLWVPIPRDRDQAFVLFDGLLPGFARQTFPQLLKFGPSYGAPVGATWNGRDLDRRFLTPLSRPTWDSMAAELASLLTDDAIDSAVARMPAEYRAINGPVLRAALVQRRIQLPHAADRYYQLLARQVDLHATDHADSAAVIRVDGEHVRVKLFSEKARAAGAPPYVDRTFSTSETSDVRLYLHGDDDRAVFEGKGAMPITVRAIGGNGEDVFDDPGRNGKVHFYDESGASTAVGHGVNNKTWPKPEPGVVGPRDWGTRHAYAGLVAGGPDVGVLFGGSATFFRYGFRKVPYSSKWRARLGYATEAQTLNGDVLGDIRLENSRTYFTLLARGSGISTLNFYGFGNNTPETEPASFYRVRQHQFTLEPAVTFGLSRRSTLTLAARGVYSVTKDDEDRFIGTQTVLGTGNFGQIGAAMAFDWTGKSPPAMTATGFAATVAGSIYAPVWSVPSTYGELHAVVNWSWNLHPKGPRPTLAFRVGGARVWGDYPFMNAAFIGGGATVRSLRYNRYAGDASLYGGAELRLRIARISALLASDLGVMGLVDVGRVFVEGESSDTWHPAYGGGIWLAFLNGRTRATVSVAGGEGSARFYFNFGLSP